MGAGIFPQASRALLALAVFLVIAVPLPGLRASAAADPVDAEPHTSVFVQPTELRDPDHPVAERFSDYDLGLTIVPPPGWQRSPATSLNPVSDPPEPVQEAARFQLHLGDPQLYAAPIPITSGLIADAGAVISIGVAREGSDILLMERGARGTREVSSVPGFTVLEDDATYEGLHILTRYLFSRDGDRVLVARAAASAVIWDDLEEALRASLRTFTGDPKAANAPAPPPPPPPPPPPLPPAVEAPPDPTIAIRNAIVERAGTLLGLRYVWGGNSTLYGMDCSAYVSWVWGVSRYTTDSIWNVSFPISKDELLPGDALNLTTGRDPQHFGHIRLFEAWANAAHTAMWVYEETPPRVVHRVVTYDDRYQPIRLDGLSGAGEARLIPATPAPETPAPAPFATRRPTPIPTRTPFRTATPRPTVRPTSTPIRTATPVTTPTPLHTPTPTRTPSPTLRTTTAPSPTRTPTPTVRR